MNQHSSAYEVIESHNQNIQVSLYTPAHQGIARQSDRLSQEIYRYDVPFLTRPRTEGVEKYLSQLYGTKHTFTLTGGGTQGVLTACALLGTRYRRVAIAANSHISTINGIILAGLEPYIIPSRSWMPTTEETIAALEASNVSALLLTHPSYEGITLDLPRIAAYCRQQNIALVIDGAHDSHFPFLDDRWQSAIAAHPDIVTHSMHKYAGSLVQTALLHLPEGSRFTQEDVMGVLPLFETTTRSNLLLLSLENAIEYGFSQEGKSKFENNIEECDRLRSQLDNYGSVLTYNRLVRDPLKIYLQSDRVTGEVLEELLYERGVDGEYAEEEGILLIFSFNHDLQHFQHLSEVFANLVPILGEKPVQADRGNLPLCRRPQMKMLPKNAFFAPKETLALGDAIGKTSSCCIKKVPPGIPILIPGEEVTNWHLQVLEPNTMINITC
ncbi:MAG: aminotransferase class I/II-fold pyridoxal phosphate-dependent enzyme [Cyanobacteria bacterium P01_E01_bin.42]